MFSKRFFIQLVLILQCLNVSLVTKAETQSQTVSLNLNAFIELSNQQSFDALQYQKNRLGEQLQLDIADQRFVPKLNLTSKLGREQKDQYITTYINNHTSGIDSTASVDWLLPSGANLSLSYQYQHGIAHGLTSLGIPESKQHTITTTTRIEQPVWGGLWNNQQTLPQKRAELQWQYYQTQGQQLLLQTQLSAYSAFLDFQEQVDLVKLLSQSLNYAQFRESAVQARLEEGLIVKADLLNAKLEVHQRQLELKKAKDELNLIQKRISAQINSHLNIRLQPLSSMLVLDECSINPSDLETGSPYEAITKHPDLTLTKIKTDIAYNDVKQNQYELLPQITLFYENTDNRPLFTQDTSEQSWGIQATYRPFNTEGKLTKQQLKAEWMNASYTQEATRQELLKNINLNQESQKQLQEQLTLTKQGEDIAKQAFKHAQERFKHGVDSILQVKAAQDDWLKQQRITLTALKALLTNRIILSHSTGKILNLNTCDKNSSTD